MCRNLEERKPPFMGLYMGEFAVAKDLAARVLAELGEKVTIGRAEPVEAACALGLQYLAVCPGGYEPALWQGITSKAGVRRALSAGLSVVALVSGGFTRLSLEWGLGETIALCKNRPEEARSTMLTLAAEAVAAANTALEWGAEAIVLGEDLGWGRGLFLGYPLTRSIIYPALEAFTEGARARVILHSDGDVVEVLPDLLAMGFSGFHSMEETGRMSPGFCAGSFGKSLHLMGGVPSESLRSSDTAHMVARKMALDMAGAGYTFGTSSGILDDSFDASAVICAYQSYYSRIRADAR